jgi:hypothetical protein
VTVDYGEAALRVEVTDTGHGFADSAAEAAYAAYFIGAALPVPTPPAGKRDQNTTSAGTVLADTGGHGLRGMRERATAAGGTMDIGAPPAGGFRVAATLPLDTQPAAKPAATTPTQEAAR